MQGNNMKLLRIAHSVLCLKQQVQLNFVIIITKTDFTNRPTTVGLGELTKVPIVRCDAVVCRRAFAAPGASGRATPSRR